jgi:hypothetical protein
MHAEMMQPIAQPTANAMLVVTVDVLVALAFLQHADNSVLERSAPKLCVASRDLDLSKPALVHLDIVYRSPSIRH